VEKSNIKVDPRACCECGCCQLICSYVYTGAFNPEKARIVLDLPEEIRFTHECVANCSLCTKYCAYDAIITTKNTKV
jgi:hypothetical protein